jgi:hypothetical protein
MAKLCGNRSSTEVGTIAFLFKNTAGRNAKADK